MHYLVWFGGHPNQLQRSPLQCPWSGVFKKVYHVGVNIDYLGCLHWRLQLEVTMISCRGHPNQLQRSPLHCPWCGIFKKVYHVGVNMHYLVWFGLVVTQISCRGHHDQLQRSPKSAAEVFIALSLVWDFQKGIICRGKYALFGLVWFGGHQNQLQRSPLHSGHIKHGRVIFHEIPIKLYNGVRIPRRCPQVVYNLQWHTCMSPGVTDKRKFDEKL